MLRIITGRTGSGKTRKVRSVLADIAKNSPDKAIIIVPEQFSFETERAMLYLLGNEKVNNIEVLSFSRLAEKLLKRLGKLPQKCVDDSARAILMSIAVEALQDKTVSFRKYVKNPALINELVAFRKELKKCRISPENLGLVSGKMRRESFSLKLSELADIYRCYDALVSDSFGDDTDFLDILAETLETDDFFKGKTVAVDGFSGFSAQEYSVLEKIMKSADELYVTFCYDSEARNGKYDVFRNVHKEIKALTDIANRAGVRIASRENLLPQEEYKANALNFLEKNIFGNKGEIFDGNASSVSLIPCKNKKDECDAVAAEIRRLVRTENYRYRDIAVIERAENTYKNDMANSFRKYGIKCFFDSRQPVLTQPLIVFIRTLFDIIVNGFSADSVFTLLKTNLYGFTTEEICAVEDYVLMWNLKSSAWKNEWTDNPKGFGAELDEISLEELSELNSLRKRIVAPILSLKNKITDTDGLTISKEVFTFLRNVGVDENLKIIADALKNSGDSELSIEQSSIWKMTADIFDTLNFAVGEKTVSVSRFAELFDILVSSKDIGVIPNGIDEVIIGSADRIRVSAPRAVFIVGANSGVFPGVGSGGVLLSDKERTELIENQIDLISNIEYNSVSELFIAYRAVSLSTDKLYVSYSSFGTDGESLFPSEIVAEIKALLPNCQVIENDVMSRIESEKSAFSVLAGESVNGSVLASSLYEYFKENSENSRIQMIDKIRKNTFLLKNRDIAEKLFGKNMFLTASRTEKYYSCPFGYFCQYGIKAKAKKSAEVDPAQAGTLIHYVLETILREYPKEKFIALSNEESKNITYSIIDSYIEEQMSGSENKSASFNRTLELIKYRTYRVVLRLIDEFKNCDFTPVSFELNINIDGDIPAYKLSLDGAHDITVVGKVDRVDSWQNGENNYIRVIDYKTGGKEFKLSEVLQGINMQMLIYLFAIWQNGGEKFGNVVPAGVLYFPAKHNRLTPSKAERYVASDTLRKAENKEYKLNGMVLNNIGVITAMDRDAGGVLIPSSIDKSGNAKGNIISLKSLYKLKDYIDGEIKDMANSLYNGEIDAVPTEKACEYCDYKTVCKREADGKLRELEEYSFNDAIAALGGDDGE